MSRLRRYKQYRYIDKGIKIDIDVGKHISANVDVDIRVDEDVCA